MSCPMAPSSSCQGSGVTFSYTSLDQFKDVDEVSKILDSYFHAEMHVDTALADRTPALGCNLGVNPPVTSGCYNLDTLTPTCAPRDPEFWRLHKAIDDVVRAWQDQKATDVVLVIDRSGSMSESDSGGGTKLQGALDAVGYFADLMNTSRADGQVNRVGVVSYSDNATTDMALTNTDSHLKDPGGPLETAISNIAATGPGGCTAIGKGIQAAVDILCPGGTCQGFSSTTGNARKAILVMTDGIENVPPCLQPAGPTGGTCSNQCFGAQFNYDNLAFTQLVSVGFGSGTDLNGPLLTLLAERQGGIYMQNPNSSPANDLKNFYAKAFGQLTSEFLLMDPQGLLPASQAATDPVKYNGCGDSILTFASGWNTGVTPGDLTLVIDNPSGDLVLPHDPEVQNSQQGLYHYSRVNLPYKGAVSGTWRSQIVRRHQIYVNGFTTDAFANLKQGTVLIRREIHRLCPQGCESVLYYEHGRRTPQSVYRDALDLDRLGGALQAVDVATTNAEFTKALGKKWDLIVYGEMGQDVALPSDQLLARLLCGSQRAIITDVRMKHSSAIFECSRIHTVRPNNWSALAANTTLVDTPLKLVNHGYPIFTYGLAGPSVQATSAGNPAVGAVVARTNPGKDEYWFVDVLGDTLGKLSPHNRSTNWKTGTVPIAEVRMLPSNIRRGGWDKVDAKVEVEYPKLSVGELLARQGLGEPQVVDKERIDPRTAALAKINLPTATKTYQLYDDGTHGDLYANNAYWTAELTGLGKTDGPYKLRYMFDLTAGNCTTHRELLQSFYMDVGVDPKSSKISLGAASAVTNGWRKFDVDLRPVDVSGNPLGPGRTASLACAPKDSCRVEPKLIDAGRGVYKATAEVAPKVGSIQLRAFGTAFDVAVPCDKCPQLASIKIEPTAVQNYQPAEATLTLSAPAPSTPEGGAVVFLSSNLTTAASVAQSVVVPAGKTTVAVPLTVYHVHDEPGNVTISAVYGSQTKTGSLTVSDPDARKSTKKTPHYHGDD
jgi:hypothetical protein